MDSLRKIEAGAGEVREAGGLDAPIPPPPTPPKQHSYKNIKPNLLLKNIESCKLLRKEGQQKSINQFWVSRNEKVEMMMIMKMMMMKVTVVAIQRYCNNMFSESSSSEINPKPLDFPNLPTLPNATVWRNRLLYVSSLLVSNSRV